MFMTSTVFGGIKSDFAPLEKTVGSRITDEAVTLLAKKEAVMGSFFEPMTVSFICQITDCDSGKKLRRRESVSDRLDFAPDTKR